MRSGRGRGSIWITTLSLDRHYYSTPYQLVGKEVDVRSTSGTVEIFYQGKRVASHVRSTPGV